MVSSISCLTIVPESTVFGILPKNPMISRGGRFGGTADGIVPKNYFLIVLFQCFRLLIDNRVGMIFAGLGLQVARIQAIFGRYWLHRSLLVIKRHKENCGS
jgi:hypothetical protein